MISKEEFAVIAQEKKGPNNIPVDAFYDYFKSVAEKSKWGREELGFFNQLIQDGMGPLLQAIFQDKLHHPEYDKYYGSKQFKEAPSMEDMIMISRALKEGKIKSEDLLATGMFKISSSEEFSTTDKERKVNQIAMKREQMEELSKSQKLKTRIHSHKSKR
jgi:hypothetical protein